MISSMQIIYHILVLSENLFRETEAQVSSVAALLILGLHLYHDARAVIGKVDGVFLIQAHPDYVAVPAHSLILIESVELCNCLMRILKETVEAAVFPVAGPAETGDRPYLMIVLGLCQQEHIYSEATCESHNDIQQVSSCEYYSDFTSLEGEKLVLEGRKAEE